MRIFLACILLTATLFAPPALAQDAAREYPFAADAARTRLIQARILTENGRLLESEAIYLELLRTAPHDPDILSPFVDLLIRNREYARAEDTLVRWLDRTPDNPDALDLLARLYVETNRPEAALPLYDKLLEVRPATQATLLDSGYALQEAGDWPKALDRFSRAVDLNPDNPDADEALRTLLLAHSPVLNIGFTYVDDPDNAWMRTYDVSGEYPLNGSTRMEAGVTMVQANREDIGAGGHVDRSFWYEWARVRHTFAKDWDVMVGAGVHDDWSFGFAQELGLTWRVHRPGQIDLLLERSKPYTDSVDAVGRHMTYDGARLGYTGFYNDQWGLSLAGYVTQYCIDHGVAYATRWGVDFSATRRLLRDPDIFLTYTFNRSTRDYIYDTQPVDFAAAEQIHGLTLSMEQRPVRWFSYALSTSAQKDFYKPQVSFAVDAAATVHLGDRFQWSVGQTWATDAGETDTVGATQTWRTDIRYIF